MQNVFVYGQPSTASFSGSSKYASRHQEKLRDKNYIFPRTYMVSAQFYKKFWWLNSSIERMHLFYNGKQYR